MKVLYISYDGMTDNLGQSQVIPYLIGLTNKGFAFDIISCEKKENYKLKSKQITELLKNNNIGWYPISYTKNPPILSTLFDVRQLFAKANKLQTLNNYNIVHCRSYIPSLIGLSLKQKYGCKFIFDMRGFWADERVDGGLWKLNNPIFNKIFNFFKQKEKDFLNNADAIISLTNKGKNEMLKWNFLLSQKEKIKVIPCCSDFEHFVILPKNIELKTKLGFTNSDKILGYLGSLGTWYMLDEMLETFNLINLNKPNFKFLVITPEPSALVFEKALAKGIDKNKIKVVFANRNELPQYLSLVDIGISFIKPSYSKLSSSPTKMGEMFACGIPIICNSNVGDVEEYVNITEAGFVINDFSHNELENTVAVIDKLLSIDKETTRKKAYKIFSLEKGIEAYFEAYKLLN